MSMKEYTPRISEHTKSIILWRESLLKKSDEPFFDLMQTYLGKLKMPFDKNKLIPELEKFLFKEENQKNIISLLSESDLYFLSAIHFIPDTNFKRLSALFYFDFPEQFIEEILFNLEDRLLVFSYVDEDSKETLFKINPHLEEAILPLLSKERLFASACHSQDIYAISRQPVSFELITGFLSYVNSNKELCKKDGTIKKRAVSDLQKIFGENFSYVIPLKNALCNLGLLKEAEEELTIDWNRLESFTNLTPSEQKAYLTVSATSRFSRELLRKYASLFLNTYISIPESGISKSAFIKKAFLNSLKPLGDETVLGGMGNSRFASILNRARQDEENQENPENRMKSMHNNYFSQMEILECIADDAVNFGFLKTENEENVPDFFEEDDPLFEAAESMNTKPKFHNQILYRNFNAVENYSPEKNQMLHIDGAFNLSLMPGYGFQELLPLIKFLDMEKFDTVSQFAISRESVIRGFETGLTSSQIISFLKDSTNFSLPQTLVVSIEEWYKNYNSVRIYSGFVLKLNVDEAFKAEKNPIISEHIIEKLSEGIYLLDTESEKETQELLRRSGFEMSRTIRKNDASIQTLSFSPIYLSQNAEEKAETIAPKFQTKNLKQRKDYLKTVYGKIKALNYSREENDQLLRIANSKLIVSDSQSLDAFTFTEVTTAESMDYSGKIHQLENAIRNHERIIFTTIQSDEEINCQPVMIDKTSFSDGAYIIVDFDNGNRDTFSIGQIKYVHRIPKFGHSKSREL